MRHNGGFSAWLAACRFGHGIAAILAGVGGLPYAAPASITTLNEDWEVQEMTHSRINFARFARYAFVTAALVGSVVAATGRAEAQTPLCGTVTESVHLTGDCIGPMVVEANNITINLNGFAVRDGQTGISIINRVKVRVLNGEVRNNVIGIQIAGGSPGGGHMLEGLRIADNSVAGVAIVLPQHGNRVVNNEIIGDTDAGTPDSGGTAIILNSDGNLVVRNILSNGTGSGIAVGGSDNTIVNNSASNFNNFDYIDDTNPCANLWRNNAFSFRISEADPGCIQ